MALMSALGQKRTLRRSNGMSALPPKADIVERDRHVRFVAKADILRCSKERRFSITSSARTINDRGTLGPSGLGGLKPDHQLVRISRKTGTAQLFGSGAKLVAKSDNLRWRTT
jgi:hypothetical protein